MPSRPKPARVFSILLVAMLTMSSTGCLKRTIGDLAATAGRQGVSGVMVGLRTDSNRVAIRQLIDTTAFHLSNAMERQIIPRIDASLDATMTRVAAHGSGLLDTVARNFAVTLDGPLNRTFQSLLSTTLVNAGAETRRQMALTIGQGGRDIEQELLPRFELAATRTTDAVLARVLASLDVKFRAALDTTVAGAVRAGLQAADSHIEQSRFWKRIVLGVSVFAVLLSIGAGVLWYRSSQNRRALEAVTDVIEKSKNDDIKRDVTRRANELGVESHLHNVLVQQEYSK